MDWNWTDQLRRSSLAQRWPIGTTLWLFVTIIMALGWLAVFAQVRSERDEAEGTAIAQAQNRAITLEQYVARTFQAADLVTLHLGYKYLIHRDLPPAARTGAKPLHIADPIIDRRLFVGAHVINPAGDILATTLRRSARTNVATHPIYRRHAHERRQGLQISKPLPSRFIGGTHVHASRRVEDGRGRTLGFADVQMSPAQLLNFPEHAAFQPTDLVSVIGLEGTTLARREGNRISSGQDLKGRLVMRMQHQNPNGTYLGPSSLDGHVRYFSHRRLSGLPIFVTAGVSRDAAMAPANARARIYYLVMAVFTITTAAIAFLTLLAVSARQRRASALAEANRRLAEAQRVAKIGDWQYDVASGAALWSDQLCIMYERPPSADRLTLEDYRSYLSEEGSEALAKSLELALRTGEPQSFELTVRLPSGSTSERHIIAVPVRDADGKIYHLHGTDQDISDEKLLHSLQAQVAHLSRLDAMNMMASTLAHELNQPLTAASNYLSAGERLVKASTLPKMEVAKEALGSARAQIHAAAGIIRRVREMLRQQPAARDGASVPEAISNAISLLATTGVCRRDLIQPRLDPDAQLVAADAIQLQQVLVNLLRNACEAADERNPSVSITTAADAEGFVSIKVEDNGEGFSRPFAEIFKPYASEKLHGLGLGLSISRSIVEYHGGQIWVERTDPSGSVIAFKLPRAQDVGEEANSQAGFPVKRANIQNAHYR